MSSSLAAPMTQEQCLACHGPYDAIVQKNLQIESDSGPVNPHTTVPHDNPKGEIPECIGCHQQPHPLPPPKGFKDMGATLDGCYSCHHNYEFKKCSDCHSKK